MLWPCLLLLLASLVTLRRLARRRSRHTWAAGVAAALSVLALPTGLTIGSLVGAAAAVFLVFAASVGDAGTT